MDNQNIYQTPSHFKMVKLYTFFIYKKTVLTVSYFLLSKTINSHYYGVCVGSGREPQKQVFLHEHVQVAKFEIFAKACCKRNCFKVETLKSLHCIPNNKTQTYHETYEVHKETYVQINSTKCKTESSLYTPCSFRNAF